MLGLVASGFNPSRGRQASQSYTEKLKNELLTSVTIGATASKDLPDEVRNKILFFLVLGMNLGLCTC